MDYLIHDNKAGKAFQAYGYQFVTGRGYASFNDISNSDIYLNYAIEQGIWSDTIKTIPARSRRDCFYGLRKTYRTRTVRGRLQMVVLP